MIFRRSSLYFYFSLAFWVQATLTYAVLNRLGQFALANRIVLSANILLICVIGFTLKRSEHQSKHQHINAIALSVALYVVYISASLVQSIAIDNIPISSTPSIIINAILPPMFYFASKSGGERGRLIYVLSALTFVNIIVAIVASRYFFLELHWLSSFADDAAHRGGSDYRLQSLMGSSTILSYFSLVCLAAYLFFPQLRWRYVMIPMLVIAILFSRQRAAWAGALIVLVFLGIHHLTKRDIRVSPKSALLLLSAIVMTTLFLVFYADLTMLRTLISNTWERLSLSQALADRSSQHIVHNYRHILFILFGEGFGKYSPLVQDNPLAQPDAPLLMLYNETGLIGLIIFSNMLFQMFWRSLEARNWFLASVVTFTSVGLLGTRYLWYFPINFLFFYIVAAFQGPAGKSLTRKISIAD